MRARRLCFAALAAAAAVLAAGLPYAGKWKMNPAKSDFGQTTITYEQLSGGEMRGIIDGQPYTFRMDGKDYPDPFGDTAAWKSLNANTWETTWKLKGKVLGTDNVSVSPDGKTLTIHSKGTKPNGDKIDDVIVFQRVSGGPGLAGKWQTKNLKSSSPNVVELAPSGTDGLTYKVVDMNLTCDAKLDGKDYPCTGPTLAPGWTVAIVKSGASSLDMTVKLNGKMMYKVAYAASADGKTLTETGGSTTTNEKVKVVYDRQ